jgi:hypothetical protein
MQTTQIPKETVNTSNRTGVNHPIPEVPTGTNRYNIIKSDSTQKSQHKKDSFKPQTEYIG